MVTKEDKRRARAVLKELRRQLDSGEIKVTKLGKIVSAKRKRRKR